VQVHVIEGGAVDARFHLRHAPEDAGGPKLNAGSQVAGSDDGLDFRQVAPGTSSATTTSTFVALNPFLFDALCLQLEIVQPQDGQAIPQRFDAQPASISAPRIMSPLAPPIQSKYAIFIFRLLDNRG